MKLQQASDIANDVILALAPHCTRIAVAGSIRRRRLDVGDIEIVCIPRESEGLDLFGAPSLSARVLSWSTVVVGLGRKIKGDPVAGRYIQIDLGAIKLDLFTATPDNWGLIYAIRTGCAAFSHHVLACAWARRGYKSVSGMMTFGSVSVSVPEEIDLFTIAGVKYVEPWERN